MPVEGPPRMTLATTMGVSLATARPRPSIMRLRPGPEVAVREGTPPKEPPMIMLTEASSSSAWSRPPPTFSRRGASHSSISVAGVMG